MAEALNLDICPHFLMELHVSLSPAVPNTTWVEYLPPLDSLTHSRVRIDEGYAYAPNEPGIGIGIGIGIDWDRGAIRAAQHVGHSVNAADALA